MCELKVCMHVYTFTCLRSLYEKHVFVFDVILLLLPWFKL